MLLIGDAIHPTTPNMANGGCLAIEDAYLLAKMLENDSIESFSKQIEKVKAELSKMTLEQNDTEQKLKIVQDFTVHLSFHLGEIVLVMRQNGHYPMPDEMKAFLTKE